MNLHRKIAVTAIFALGALYISSQIPSPFNSLSLYRAVIISTVRTVISFQLKRADERADRHQADVDKDLVLTLAIFWFLIESQVALIAACLPPLYGLFGHRLLDSITRSVQSLRSRVSPHGSNSRDSYTNALHQYNSTVKDDRIREPRGSDASRAPILPSSFAAAEPALPMATFAMSNWDEEIEGRKPLKNGEIHVQKAVTQTATEA
ncbi:MAG: hypothetical protein Q9160_008288 [Pyrenula sp. 1 TL-2023]